MKTKRKTNKKAGMIRNLSFRELTGKNTLSMRDDLLHLEELREKQLERNREALNLIEDYKNKTNNGNTDDLNDIKVALEYLSKNINKNLLLIKDKEDLRDFKLKLIKKRNELDNKKQRTARGKKRKRRKTRRGRK